MTLEQAQAWVLIITALAGAIASVIAAVRSGGARDSATAALHQAALNREVSERVDTKMDENTRLTAEIHGNVTKGPGA